MKKQIAVALLLTCACLAAQESDTDETEPIRVDVNVVNVPVTVSSEEGKFIIDLNKEDFEVFEDGKRVQIRYFARSTDTENLPPLYAGFLIDLSNTARVYYKTYQETIGDLAYILIPEGGRNQGFLIGYHTEVDLLVKMTKDPYLIAESMRKLKHGGGSSMIDAAYQACQQVLATTDYQGVGEPRKVIVIVGDGHDNASKHTVDEVIAAAHRAQVTIYGVSTVAWGFHEKEEKNLKQLTKATGGRMVHPMEDVHSDISGYLSKPQDAGNFARTVGTGEYARAQLEALYKAILDVSGAVQSQYILGYAPPVPFSDGRFRRIEVKVKINADTQVDHRAGYYPPGT
jgi:Ca-activated chloride channel family protein